MDHEQFSAVAHTSHPIKAPLDDLSVQRLLGRAVARPGSRVLDLGCGTAEWLLRALTARPDVLAEGVDVSEIALATARERAVGLGVGDRLTLHRTPAADFAPPHRFDTVLSVGAVHAFGGLVPTLAAARAHLAPGGSVLVGTGFWQRPPTPEAVAMLGDLDDLAATVDRVVADGWTPVDGHVSTQQELDAYEWACWGTLAAWGLDRPGTPGAADALAWSTARLGEWLHDYRDAWGFVTLVLRRAVE